MGIVSSEEFNRQIKDSSTEKLNSTNKSNVITPQIVPLNEGNEHGRNEGDVNVPNSLRNLIGATNIEDGRQGALRLARQFGISDSSVSAYSNGATSTKSYDETPNKSKINGVKERLGKRARHKLNLALSHITEEKLEVAKVNELASVAKAMADVSKAMEPDAESDDTNKAPVQFVFYAPQVNQENNYKTIVAKDDY